MIDFSTLRRTSLPEFAQAVNITCIINAGEVALQCFFIHTVHVSDKNLRRGKAGYEAG